MASTYLQRTMDGAESSQKGTFSFWIKRSKLGAEQTIFSNVSYQSGWSTYGQIRFRNPDDLEIRTVSSGVEKNVRITSRKFRDTNAWYHIVISFDFDSSTADNYIQLYVNGVKETDFVQYDNLSGQTNQFFVGSDLNGQRIGNFNTGEYFDGSMSHFHCTVGTVYDASAFGETDSTTGEWKIKANPSVTYGNGGFFILKNGNSVTDQSGNGNNFTSGGGTLTNTEDSPSNVFATMNPSDNFYANATLSNGNTTVATDGTNETYITSTLAASTGKWYWEVEFDAGSDNSFIGIIDRVSDSSSFQAYIDATNGISYKKNGSIYTNGGNISGVNIGSYTTGDIISVAMDLDNNKLYFGKNGSWLNSGVPTSGSTGTGAFSINSSPTDGVYYAQVGDDNTGSQTLKCNFGNGYFGTTAVASAGTNASGNGIFEYDVPTGFTALSTKGLNL